MTARGTGARAASRLLAATGGAVLLLVLAAPGATAGPGPAPLAVSPTGTSTLRGVLTLGSPAVPVGGQKVTLHGVATGADALTLAVVTDAKGRFVFDKLAGGDAWSYTVTTDHEGSQFTTDALAVEAGSTLTTTLATYDVTTSAAALTWPSWLVWIDEAAPGIAVQQDVAMRNSGTTAYIGTTPVADAPDAGKAAVELPVTSGATSLSYLGAFEVCCDAIVASTWQHTRPVPPGTTNGTLRYETPTPSTLTFPVTVQTEKFELLVPTSITVSSPELAPAGTQTDRGVTYQVLRGGPLAVGTTVTVTLGTTGSSPAPWIALGLVGLVLVGAAAWFWQRSRAAQAAAAAAGTKPGRTPKGAAATKRGTSTKGTAPAKGAPTKATPTKAPPAAKGAKTAPARPATPPTAAPPKAAGARPEDTGAIADELAMLDLAHENGALPDEASYQRVREALVARLVAALGEDPDALSTRDH